LCIESEKPIKVLDVACGAGNWALSIAKYNPNAEVIGIDIDQASLNIAREYKKKFSCDNARFYELSYDQVAQHFQPSSFDYVFTMSALHLFDESRYFENVSRILRHDGRLIIFWEHGIGYYLQQLFLKLLQGSLRSAHYQAAAIIRSFLRAVLRNNSMVLAWSRIAMHDHPLVWIVIRKSAAKHGIGLQRLGMSSLCKTYYRTSFLLLPYIFNLIGKKVSCSFERTSNRPMSAMGST
jgi:SAM-dependent methyltransferase